MTFNDQIRKWRLQYDVNREGAKILALSSGKIHKSKHLTDEDILPSNQQQIIEQAKFTYPLLVKASEQEIKTIEDEGGKEIDVLKDFKPKVQRKTLTHKSDDDNDKTSNSKEIYDGKLEERIDEIISKKISHVDLVYDFKGQNSSTNVDKYGDRMNIYGHLQNSKKILEEE